MAENPFDDRPMGMVLLSNSRPWFRNSAAMAFPSRSRLALLTSQGEKMAKRRPGVVCSRKSRIKRSRSATRRSRAHTWPSAAHWERDGGEP
jgi:hypothetical protein